MTSNPTISNCIRQTVHASGQCARQNDRRSSHQPRSTHGKPGNKDLRTAPAASHGIADTASTAAGNAHAPQPATNPRATTPRCASDPIPWMTDIVPWRPTPTSAWTCMPADNVSAPPRPRVMKNPSPSPALRPAGPAQQASISKGPAIMAQRNRRVANPWPNPASHRRRPKSGSRSMIRLRSIRNPPSNMGM